MGNSTEGNTITTLVPHAEHGDPKCPGLLHAFIENGLANIYCNECRTIVQTVATELLPDTLEELEDSSTAAVATCQHCGDEHRVIGLDTIFAFVCPQCGKPNPATPTE
jgi:hypothetical protein